MAKTIIEKATCEKCGVNVREGTTFCYNCGAQVANMPIPADKDVKDTNSDKASIPPVDPESGKQDKEAGTNADKLAKAAGERKKARVSLRKGNEYIWEPVDDSRLIIVAGISLAVIALLVVLLLVFWK